MNEPNNFISKSYKVTKSETTPQRKLGQAGAELGQAQLPTGIWLYWDKHFFCLILINMKLLDT